jgi:hypothetical protein
MSHITTFAHGDTYFGDTIQNPANPNLDSYFYLSFEDALWDFLSHKVKPGAVLLFGDFFCVDVWDNCRAHGYNVETYSVEDNLQTKADNLYTALERYKPDAVFIFHPLGIPNQLLNTELFNNYNGFVIEDSVHRIVEPTKIQLLSNRHIIIDSTRKLTPLPGSQIWAQKGVLDYPQQIPTSITEKDTKKALTFWNEFQTLIKSQNFENVTYAYQLLNSGDNLIGDSIVPVRLSEDFLIKRQYINLEVIKHTKIDQCNLYQNLLSTILKDDRFVIPWQLPTQKDEIFNGEELAFYPIIFKSDYAFLLKEYLLNNKIQTFVEFSDSPWAINKNVICLPVGPHVTTQQVTNICTTVLEWFAERSLLA